MTLLEDSLDEMVGMFGETITGYHHLGYTDSSGEDFWHEDDGHDKNNPYTFEAIPESVLDDQTLEDAGFESDTDSVLRTSSAEVEEGDLIEFAGKSFIVREEENIRMAGDNIMKILALRQVEQ